MVQFRGSDDSIINKAPLRYSPFFFASNAGIFILCLLSLLLANITTDFFEINSQLKYVIISCFLIAFVSLKYSLDKILIKKVSLYDVDQNNFKLIIDDEEMIFKKNEILRTKAYMGFRRHRFPSTYYRYEGTYVIKLETKAFRFSSKEHTSYLFMMKQYFDKIHPK